MSRRILEMAPMLAPTPMVQPVTGSVVRVELDAEHRTIVSATLLADEMVQLQAPSRVWLRRLADLERAARQYDWRSSELVVERHGQKTWPDAATWVDAVSVALRDREASLGRRAT